MPVLVETSASTHVLLQQWQHIFDRGHIQGPALAMATAVTYGYVAWTQAASGASWRPFATAAGLTLGIIPYTLIFMGRVNSELFRAVEQSSKGEIMEKQRAGEMITLWTGLHAVRSLLPLAGAVTGLLAMLGMLTY